MVVRLSSQQSERARQLNQSMRQITTAIRLARCDRSSSPQVIKELLDMYCRGGSRASLHHPASGQAAPVGRNGVIRCPPVGRAVTPGCGLR